MHRLVTPADTLPYAVVRAISASIAATAWVAVNVHYLLYLLIKVPGIVECRAFCFYHRNTNNTDVHKEK